MRAVPGGVQLLLHVQPGAVRTGIAGLHGGALKVRVAAPPVEGRANRELLDFLGKVLGVGSARLVLVKGESGRRKTVVVQGMEIQAVRQRLGLDPTP